jgi:hypothetical protein
LFLLGFLAAVQVAFAQQVGPQEEPQKVAGPAAEPETYFPTIKLDLAQGKAAPGAAGSPVVYLPIQCTSRGDLLLRYPHPPDFDFKKTSLVSLSEKKSVSFDLSTIPKLQDVEFLSFFPAESEVVVLLTATTDATESSYTVQLSNGKTMSGRGKLGEHHNFLALFDLDGRYKSTVDLPETIQYKKAAELSNGDFLLLGYDPVNGVAALQLVNSSGQVIGPLQIPNGMTDDEKLKNGETGGPADKFWASGVVSFWQFIPAAGKVLLVRPHSGAPILAVGPGGFVREVPIAPPAGFELDGFLPSSQRWIARFRRVGLSKEAGVSVDSSMKSGNYKFAELNRDGSVRSLFEIGEGSAFNIVCEFDGTLKSYSVSQDVDSATQAPKFLVATTDLPK